MWHWYNGVRLIDLRTYIHEEFKSYVVCSPIFINQGMWIYSETHQSLDIFMYYVLDPH